MIFKIHACTWIHYNYTYMYMYVGLELQKELEMYKKMNNGMSLEIKKLKSLVNVKEGTVSHNSTYMYTYMYINLSYILVQLCL